MKKLLSLAGAALILSSGLIADTTPAASAAVTPAASATAPAKHVKAKHKRAKRAKKTKTPTPVAGEAAK